MHGRVAYLFVCLFVRMFYITFSSRLTVARCRTRHVPVLSEIYTLHTQLYGLRYELRCSCAKSLIVIFLSSIRKFRFKNTKGPQKFVPYFQCKYVYIYIYIHICRFVCIYISLFLLIYLRMKCMYSYMFMCVSKWLCKFICSYVHIYIRVCLYIY